MRKRLMLAAPSVIVALVILVISVFRTTSAKIVFGHENYVFDFSNSDIGISIDYSLPETLEVYPDNVLWKVKAIEDKTVLSSTFDKMERSRLMRGRADERLVAGIALLHNSNDINSGLMFLHKAEDYLYSSLNEIQSINTLESRAEFKQISLASLKHRELLEESLVAAPDELRPQIVEILDKSKLTYKESRVLIELFGDSAPRNVFDEK